MQKVVMDRVGGYERGAYLDKDGTIVQYGKQDLDEIKRQVRIDREISERAGRSEVQHLATIPYEVIEMVRREMKWPNDAHHRKLAIKECVKRVYSGEMRDFRVWGA